MPNLMKFLPVGAKLLQADGQKDIHDEANSSLFFFRNFAKAPKIG